MVSWFSPTPGGIGAFIQAAFRCTPGYRDALHAFPLDPRALPLDSALSAGPGGWPARGLEPPLAVFAEALPDAWGRRLLVRRHRLTGARQADPYLLQALGGHGLGALAFFPPERSSAALSDRSAAMVELPALVEAAHRLENDEATDPLSRGGSG